MAINTCSTVLFSVYKCVQPIIGWWIGITDLVKGNALGYGCKHLHCTTAADVYIELCVWNHGGEEEYPSVHQLICSESIKAAQLCRGTPPPPVLFSVGCEGSTSFNPPPSFVFLLTPLVLPHLFLESLQLCLGDLQRVPRMCTYSRVV